MDTIASVQLLDNDKLCVREEDAIRLILEFLSQRDLSITQLSLERESGISNCNLSDDLIFLRQLILDGQWDDVLQFVSPLECFETFASKRFKFIIYKHKYVELLCIRSEANTALQTVEVAVHEIIDCLNKLEKYCSDQQEFHRLSSLLTLPNLDDDDELKNWNPNSWRLKCFKDIYYLVERFMLTTSNKNQSNSSNNFSSEDVKSKQFATNDRLMDLIFKGLLYEVCLFTVVQRVRYLTTIDGGKRLNGTNNENFNDLKLYEPNVFHSFSEKVNLKNMFQCLPDEYLIDTFNSNKPTHLDIAKHEKPALVASWSEMILSAPIKPKIFPHINVPYTKVKAADLMSKSLTASIMHHSNPKNLMTMSVCDIAQFSSSTLAATGFHLSKPIENLSIEIDEMEKTNALKECENIMERSIDRLFKQELKKNSFKFNQDESKSNEPAISNHNRKRLVLEREMASISEKSTPIEDSKCNPDQSELNLNSSYYEIFQNYYEEKNKLIEKISDHGLDVVRDFNHPDQSKNELGNRNLNCAMRNRQESRNIATRSMSIKSSRLKESATAKMMEDNLKIKSFEADEIVVDRDSAEKSSMIDVGGRYSSINQFQTPVCDRFDQRNSLIKNTSRTSTPISNRILRPAFIINEEDDFEVDEENFRNENQLKHQLPQNSLPSSTSIGIRTSASSRKESQQIHLKEKRNKNDSSTINNNIVFDDCLGANQLKVSKL